MARKLLLDKINIEHIRLYDVYRQRGGYTAVEKALKSMSPDQVTEEVKRSGLRGRGGAGFPTGMKWGFLAKNDRPRYLCCNSDESEPGTFKDRMLMEKNPHLLVEGVLLTSYACRIATAFIFVRGELALAGRPVERAVQEAYDAGLIGKNILG